MGVRVRVRAHVDAVALDDVDELIRRRVAVDAHLLRVRVGVRDRDRVRVGVRVRVRVRVRWRRS